MKAITPEQRAMKEVLPAGIIQAPPRSPFAHLQ